MINLPYIGATLSKKKARVLELIMFNETRKNPKKDIKVFNCVNYTIINYYVCIDDLVCE